MNHHNGMRTSYRDLDQGAEALVDITDLCDAATAIRDDQSKSASGRTIVPIVLANGSETKFWPLSRAMVPKQFVRFWGLGKASMLGSTLSRLRQDSIFSPPIVICSNEHRFLVREETERAGVVPQAIIVLPTLSNTMIPIAVAALYLERHQTEVILAVLPSDHIVNEEGNFIEKLLQASELAARGKIVLMGMGCSSLHANGSISLAPESSACAEGPGRSTPQRRLNTAPDGIIVTNSKILLHELATLEPWIVEGTRAALGQHTDELGFLQVDGEVLAANTSHSAAALERSAATTLLPDCGFGIGVDSWREFWQASPRDAFGNSVQGEAMTEDTRNCYIHSEKALVATLGVKDLVIVETPDACLSPINREHMKSRPLSIGCEKAIEGSMTSTRATCVHGAILSR